jgi:hypothetical protein
VNRLNKVWVKPELEVLDINMTEAATYDEPETDEAWNGDNTRRKPDGKLVPHHES